MATLPNISSDVIKAYQDEIAKNSSPATARRKTVALNKFFDWAEGSGEIPQNPMPAIVTATPQVTKSKKKVGLRTWAGIGVTVGLVILIFLLLQKLKVPIPFISTPAQESSIQTITNNQTTINPSATLGSIPANGAVIANWNLYAKLKLTSESGTPQSGTQTLTFKIFNSASGGDALYTSDPQSITTDSNGSALISLDKVPADLFFKNNQLYLEPEIGSQVASARIPISTANVPANLNGYFPANPDSGAGPLTVPVLDANGSLNLASQSPAINAKAGNLLIQGQAVTIKATDGGNGNIEINPDGNGIAHFLFEGNGQNFLNAQAPNLTSGSLFYGMVPNNATGYNLLELQSGAPNMTTKFSVDASGNTFINGITTAENNINIVNSGNLQIAGVTRLNYQGHLTSITGYYQDSGLFAIDQGVPDSARITKKLTTSTGSALADVLTLTLDESALSTGSNYSTLVLNRLGGSSTALALKVNGNAQFNGQLQLGNFSSNPTAIGTGSLIFNNTDGKVYVWDGTSWVSVGTNFWQRNSGVVAPATITDNLAIGGTTSSAPFYVDATTGNTTTAGNVAINGGNITSTASTFNFLNDARAQTINIGNTTGATTINLTKGASGNIVLTGYNCAADANGGKLTTDTFGNVTCAADTGGGTGLAWSSLTDPSANLSLNMAADTTTFTWNAATGTNNLFTLADTTGNTGTGYLFNLNTATGSSLKPLHVSAAGLDALTVLANGTVGVGTASPISRLSVINNPGAGNFTGKAAFLVDQYENQDILTASASGAVRMTLANDGTLSLYNATSTISNSAGDITISAASNNVSFSGDQISNISSVIAGSGIFSGVLQAGFSTATTYSRFGNVATTHGLSSAQDVLINGNEELNGVLYLNGRTIANSIGTASLVLSNSPTNTSNILTAGSWDVENTADALHAALIANQTQGAVFNGDIFTASFSGTPKFTIHNDSSFSMAGLASAPVNNTSAGTVYFNTTDNSLYYRNGAGWVSLDPTKGGKNAIQALYHLLASEYQAVGTTNQFSQFESIARGVSFDTFQDTTKTDSANTTATGPVQVSASNPMAVPAPAAPSRTGLLGGQTYNTTNTDSAGNAYLGSNTVNKVFFYDRNKDSIPQVQVELGIDPNWYNGVTLSVATTSAQFSQNDTANLIHKNPNLSTTYNGSLVKATGTYSSNAQTIYITIKSPTTFDWTDYNGNSATNVTITPGTAQTLVGTVAVTFTQANYNIGDVFRIASWYTEPASANSRGAKAQFPERSYLISESNTVDVVDADTQKLWMRFSLGGTTTGNSNLIGATADPLSSITALNGEVISTNRGTVSNADSIIKFWSDSTDILNGGNGNKYRGNIAQRNSGLGIILNAYPTSYSIVNSIANDVSAAVIPNQPTQTITVSGWGSINVNIGAGGNVSEAVNFPYKFNNLPYVTMTYAGFNPTAPTSLSDCTSIAGGTQSYQARSLTTTGFNATFTSSAAYAAFSCYTWTATGVVSPRQYVAVATGAAGTDGGDTIINETDGTSANFVVGSLNGDVLWQNKIALTNNGTVYTAENDGTSNQSYIRVFYNIPAMTSSEGSFASLSSGTYFVGTAAGSFSVGGPVILGSATGTGQIQSLAVSQGTSTIDGKSNTLYISTYSGLTVLQEQQSGGNTGQGGNVSADGRLELSGSVKYYTNNYISEEMVGDIRGMWPLIGTGAIANTNTSSDVSIKAHTLTATISGTGTMSYASGVRGTGVSFNGSVGNSAYFTSNGDSADYNLTSNDVTMGAWIKTTQTALAGVYFIRQSTAPGNDFFEFDINNAGAGGTNKVRFAVGGVAALVSNTIINDGNWHFIVGISRNSGNTDLYVDGKLENTSSSARTVTNANKEVRLGNNIGADQPYVGTIDEPFVTALALSPAQIKHMYEVGYRALQGHSASLGGGAADKNQQLAGSQTPNAVVLDGRPDSNNQFMYVSSSEGGLNLGGGGVSKVDLNADTNVFTYTNSSTPVLLDSKITSLAVGYNLEAMSSTVSGTLNPGYDSHATATSGNFVSKTVTLPEAVTSVYIWTNSYVDASDGGSSLTVSASNDGGSNYVTCSNTNNDTNQTPQENEYVCKFATANTSLKVKFAFARTATKENNYIGQYGVGWTASGADFAENYVTDEKDLGIANLVRIKTGGINTLVGKTTSKYDENLMGVVSTRPGMTLGPNDGSTPGYSSQSEAGTTVVPIALSGRVPVKVNAEGGAIKKGDYITASSTPGVGMRATKAGKVIGQALEDWDPTDPNASDRVLVFINPGFTPGVLTADGSLNVDLPAASDTAIAQNNIIKMILGINDGTLQGQSLEATDSANASGSGIIKSMNDFVAGLTQNANFDEIQSTIVKAQGIASTIIKGGQIVADSITAGNTKTNLISPLADGTDVAVKLGSEATPSGKLAIQNAQGIEVANIDSQGNASFSGQLSAPQINTENINSTEIHGNNATISGELHVGKIYADQIVQSSSVLDSASNSADLAKIEDLLHQVETDQNLMKQASNWNTLTATTSANLDQLAVSNLYVTNQGAFNSLSVTSSVTIGTDLVVSSQMVNGTSQIENTLNSLSAPLRIQSLALAPVEIMSGLVKIDTHGNVEIAGDLNVAGRIQSSGLTLKDTEPNTEDASASALLSLKNAEGNEVANVNASGSALFRDLTTQGLVIASDSSATNSASFSGGVITTNSTVGSAVIPAYTGDITIKNPKINDYTLVYVTPTSTTDNYVLYIKSKQAGQFVVGFSSPLSVDVNFNWWIVQVTQ